jgi:hypothetical protein
MAPESKQRYFESRAHRETQEVAPDFVAVHEETTQR